ncbi:MAG: hypothetical protein AB7K24_12965, partial [Gemmataceae bacterium]
MSLFRIPLLTEAGQPTWIDDVDLSALLLQAGSTPDVTALLALDHHQPLPVQWLPCGLPSSVSGHTRGAILIGPARGPVSFFVRTGEGQAAASDAPAAVNIKESD